ncbi:MAG: alpha/beta hydrolase [Bacteroidales bacterium]|nr:alpha/beta hydrolase [Bacteroidales bacterium]
MEDYKIKGEAKSVVLDNSVELTYLELGENNEEVLISGAFFFYTFTPVLEKLAQRYHVYGVVMRFTGITDQKDSLGRVHWGNQWGKDIYDFATKLGIKRFHYVGKCHGTIPGWYLFRNHREMLIDFASFFLAPHLKKQVSDKWFDLLKNPKNMMAAAIRNVEKGLPKKMEEMNALHKEDMAEAWAIKEYAGCPEKLWNSLDECEQDLKNCDIPVGFLFGSDDPFFQDHYDSNMYIWQVVKGCHFVMLNGEKHLMEIDVPERVADEVLTFIDQAHKNYD